MASIKLKFKTSVIKDRTGVLYYQIIHQRTVKRINTGYQIFSCEWNEKKSSIIEPEINNSRYTQLKTIIENVNYDINKLKYVITDFENKKYDYSINDIIKAYDLFKNKTSFFNYAKHNINKLKKMGNISTAKNHESILNSFMNYRQNLDLPFYIMSSGMMKEYEAYLKLRGNCRNTTSFYMRGLRSIYNQAVEDGLAEQKDIFKYVYTGVDKTVKRAIPINAIRSIKELDLTSNHTLEIARDLFLFSFYTRGMSFIDMAYLKKKDIVGGTLIYRRHKTGQQLNIKWEKEMQTIVNKHPNPTKYLLPIIKKEDGTEYKQYRNALMLINRKLKKIAKLAGLLQVLSMYTSRHSWATVARDKKIPLAIISKGLGHNNEINTQIYLASIRTEEVDIANKIILRELMIRQNKKRKS